MKFTKGQNRDIAPNEIRDGTWIGGQNLVLTDMFTSHKSEKGFELKHAVDGTIIGVIPTSDKFIVFSVVNAEPDDFSEIGIWDGNDYAIVLKTIYLSFSIDFPIFGEYRYSHTGDLIVAWNDDNDHPRLLNLSSPPFVVDVNKEFIDSRDAILTKFFIDNKEPIYILNGVLDSGGELPTAAYAISIQYKYVDGSYGNIQDFSNFTFLFKTNKKADWVNYFGNTEGETTSKSIEYTIEDLDTRFDYFRLIIIVKTSVGVSVYLGNEYPTGYSNVVTVSTIDGLQEISLSDALIKNTIYRSVGAMTKIRDTLYFGNVKAPPELRYQKFANNIEVEWIYSDQVAMDIIDGSYKDEVIFFDNRGFPPGDVLALYIRFVGNNANIVTKAFHIPGRDAIGTDKDTTTNAAALRVKGGGKRFQFEDTATVIDNGSSSPFAYGKMGYWENANEVYPDSVEYDGSETYSGGIISGGRNLKGTPVKHHRVPSINFLMQSSNLNQSNMYHLGVVNQAAAGDFIRFKDGKFLPDDISVQPKAISFRSNSSSTGSFEDSTTWLNDTGADLTIDIDYKANFYTSYQGGASPPPEIQVVSTFKIKKIAVGGGVTNLVNDSTNVTDYIGVEYLKAGTLYSQTLLKGEKIQIEMTSNANADSRVNNFGSFMTLTTDRINIDLTSMYGRIIGIRLKNIYISAAMADNYSHFEVLFAERTLDNALVMGQSALLINSVKHSAAWTLESNAFYDFDMLRSKVALNPSHLVCEYWWGTNVTGENSGHNTSIHNIVDIDEVGSAGENLTSYSENYIVDIDEARYIEQDTSFAEPNNIKREEYIYLKPNDDAPFVDERRQFPFTIATLYGFKANLYMTFTNQPLVRTGKLHAIDGEPPTSYTNTDTIFGGDTILDLHGITRFNPYDAYGSIEFKDNPNHIVGSGTTPAKESDDGIIAYYLCPRFGAANVGVRYPGETKEQVFFPYSNIPDSVNGIGEHYLRPVEGSGSSDPNNFNMWDEMRRVAGIPDTTERPFHYFEFRGYTKAFNAINNLQPVIIFDSNILNVTSQYNRIHRTLPQHSESTSLDWRTLLPTEYKDSVSNRGEIINLDTNGLDLLVQHSKGMYVYRYRGELNLNETSVSSLGDANLFDTEPQEAIPTDVGYVGCQSKFASIHTKFGNIIVDAEQGKIFIYHDTILEISKEGMRGWFKHNLPFVVAPSVSNYLFDDNEDIEYDDGDLVLYDDSETPIIGDNPFDGKGVFTIWDEENERLIFTKRSTDVGDVEWSIDYYPSSNIWGHYHTYLPNYGIFNRKGVFYFTNDEIKEAFVGAYCKFDGASHDVSYIDVVFSSPADVDKKYLSIGWNAQVLDVLTDNINRSKTFNKMIVYNYNRHSDEIELTVYDYPDGNVRETGGTWKCNDFRDQLENKDKLVIDILNEDILEFTTIDVLDKTSDWFDNSLFIDSFIIARLVFNNTDGDAIKLSSVFTNYKPSIR